MTGGRAVGRTGGRTLIIAALLSAGPAVRLSAQCPDGTPPPCRGARVAAAPAPNSVAVLYFDSRSRDSNDLYLADGLTEEIISRLSGIERLTVRSRHLVQRYRGTAVGDPAAVGRALNVSYIVSGSVRRAGGRLRVSAELVRAEGGAQVWGRQFEQDSGDVFAIQEAVANEVATGIVGRLLPNERQSLAARPTTSPAAYEAFLRGNFDAARRDSAGLTRALQEFESALRIDPGYTDALSRSSWTYGVAAANGTHVGLPTDTLSARAVRGAAEAVRRAPNSSDAWLAMGLSRIVAQPRLLTGAREAFDRAIALDSTSAEAQHMAGFTLALLGQDSAALQHDRLALTINPARPVTYLHLVHLAAKTGRYAEARRWLDSALAADPGFAPAHGALAALLVLTGDVARARAEVTHWRDMALLQPLAGPAEQALSLAGQDPAAVNGLRGQLRTSLPADFPAIYGGYLALLLVSATRDPEIVMDVLEATRPRGAFVRYFMTFPAFDAMRGNARFARLFQETSP